MKPTEEQQAAIDASAAGKSIVLEAMAGTGKSSTLKMIAKSFPARRRILLTAFSSQVMKDAKEAGFPPNVQVKGNHSLAYGPVGAAYRDRGRMVRRLTPRAVIEVLGLRDGSFPDTLDVNEGAHLALESVLRFQQSADRQLDKKHVRLPRSILGDREEAGMLVLGCARKIWEHLSNMDSQLPITHDTYLKLWALTDPVLRYETIMVDECQDSNAVVIDLLSRQNAQLIVVGDTRQQIFSWRGAVNAMEAFNVQKRLALTQSFRYGPRIAAAANAVLLGHAKSKFTVRGLDAIDDRIGGFPKNEGPYTLIARTNSTLVGHLVDAGGRVGVVGGVNELLWLVAGAEKLKVGERAISCADLADFNNWNEVVAYAETEAGRDLSVLVKLVEEYGVVRLQQLLRTVEGNESDEGRCDVLLTTAHRSKGREWDRVLLADDFPVPTDADIDGKASADVKKSKWTPEEANLLYVACTRAKRVLDVVNHSAWQDAVGRCLSKAVEIPGVTDDYRFNDTLPSPEEGDVQVETAEAADVDALPVRAHELLVQAIKEFDPSGELAAEAHSPYGYLQLLASRSREEPLRAVATR